MRSVVLAVVLCRLILSIQATVEVMKDVTLGFGEALEHCREESQLTEDKMEDFFHFWREDFKFEDRELGCAIKCMSAHFNLLTDSNRMHHDNTDTFIKSFPNGEVLSNKMVKLIHECEQQHDSEGDHCWRILRVAECFKKSCQNHGIAPTMELLMAEFIMESERCDRDIQLYNDDPKDSEVTDSHVSADIDSENRRPARTTNTAVS